VFDDRARGFLGENYGSERGTWMFGNGMGIRR
jgi:hypothetical protein